MDHIVAYDIWCSKCKHKNTDETEDPCDECLSYPIQTDSKKPLKFEEP